MQIVQLVQIAADLQLPPLSRQAVFQPISIEPLDERLLDALVRLINLLDEPALAPRLASLIRQEIIIRLLAGPHREQLQHLVLNDSPRQQVSKAVAWLKLNFAKPLKVDKLAEHVHMSPSIFRQHFRAITGTNPLQHQKQLRLQEARQLMLSQAMDAGLASIAMWTRPHGIYARRLTMTCVARSPRIVSAHS